MHTILDSDDQEDIECKRKYNVALAQNTEMHKLLNNLEDLNKLDKEKLEEMNQVWRARVCQGKKIILKNSGALK